MIGLFYKTQNNKKVKFYFNKEEHMKLKSKKTVACFFYILFYTLSMDPMDKMEIEEEKETIETETIFKQKAPAVLMYYEEEKTPFAFLTFFNKEATNTLVRLTENLNPEDLDFIDSDNSFKENLFNLEIDLHSFSKMKLIGDTYIKCYNENLNKNALVNFEKKNFSHNKRRIWYLMGY